VTRTRFKKFDLQENMYHVCITETHRRRLFFFLPRAKDELPPFPPRSSFSLPSSPLSSTSPQLPSPLLSSPPFKIRGSGEHCKLRQWGLRRSPSRQTIWSIFESKSGLWRQQFLLIFLRTKVIFCTKKTSLILYHVTICTIDCQ